MSDSHNKLSDFTNWNIKMLCSKIQPKIENCLALEIGVRGERIGIKSVNCDNMKYFSRDHYNECTLCIPYAGRILKWDLSFLCQHSSLGPLIDFSDEKFTKFMMDHKEYVKLIKDLWNPNDDNCVFEIIKKYIECFRVYQFESMANNGFGDVIERLKRIDLNDESMEVLVENGSLRTCVEIPLDLNMFLFPKDQKCYRAYAEIVTRDKDIIWSDISYSSDLQQLLSSSQCFDVEVDKAGDSSLESHILNKSAEIRERMILLAVFYEKRKELVASLMEHFGEYWLEGDTIQFLSSHFLVNINGLYLKVVAEIPYTYPKSLPTFTLQSIYDLNDKGEIISRPLELRCNTTASVKELIAILKNAIEVQGVTFGQNLSIDFNNQ